MQTAVLTHVGLVRQRNEDSYAVLPEHSLFAVADGMGGHQAGELASSLALKILGELVARPRQGEDCREQLAQAVQEANRRVYELSQKDADKQGMGTTLTAVWIKDGVAHLAHIGDSRAYLIRNSQLSLLTNDHSLVGELLRQGSLTPSEAQSHPRRHALTRALGIEAEVKVDTRSMTLNQNDLLFLCTDGLTNLVSDEEINAVFAETEGLQAALEKLVQLCLKRGAHDNITMLAIRMD
ncbi:MAG TPA: Stp1/IreP family PP2C-type Ser/Thr phosphatase [Clostridia bacterium]|nr:Stp1/IreP family PP2C-type Ser/Thr phosphatase [Clostridia bacterium]